MCGVKESGVCMTQCLTRTKSGPLQGTRGDLETGFLPLFPAKTAM
jgi:hypothetical protein